jgi:gas vesicle protein
VRANRSAVGVANPAQLITGTPSQGIVVVGQPHQSAPALLRISKNLIFPKEFDMRNDIAFSTLAVLGGAAAGAITMFLLDPEQGQDRRNQIANNAGRAVNTTSKSARSFAGKAAQYAQDAVDQVSDSAAGVSNQAQSMVDHARAELADSIKSLADRARGYVRQGADQARNTHDQISDRANSVYGRAKSSAMKKAGVVESHPYRTAAGISVGTVSTLALGAGLMFFFDPAKGRARRAWAEQKVFSYARKVNKSASGYTRHVGNKIQGAAAQVSNAIPEEWSRAASRASNAAITAITHEDGEADSTHH